MRDAVRAARQAREWLDNCIESLNTQKVRGATRVCQLSKGRRKRGEERGSAAASILPRFRRRRAGRDSVRETGRGVRWDVTGAMAGRDDAVTAGRAGGGAGDRAVQEEGGQGAPRRRQPRAGPDGSRQPARPPA